MRRPSCAWIIAVTAAVTGLTVGRTVVAVQVFTPRARRSNCIGPRSHSHRRSDRSAVALQLGKQAVQRRVRSRPAAASARDGRRAGHVRRVGGVGARGVEVGVPARGDALGIRALDAGGGLAQGLVAVGAHRGADGLVHALQAAGALQLQGPDRLRAGGLGEAGVGDDAAVGLERAVAAPQDGVQHLRGRAIPARAAGGRAPRNASPGAVPGPDTARRPPRTARPPRSAAPATPAGADTPPPARRARRARGPRAATACRPSPPDCVPPPAAWPGCRAGRARGSSSQRGSGPRSRMRVRTPIRARVSGYRSVSAASRWPGFAAAACRWSASASEPPKPAASSTAATTPAGATSSTTAAGSTPRGHREPRRAGSGAPASTASSSAPRLPSHAADPGQQP